MARKRAAAAVAKEAPGTIVGEMNGLPVRRIRVSEIDAAHYNPRDITESALAGLKASVDEFKLVQPLVWNLRSQRLVGGHQRHKTLDPNSETDVIQVDLDEVREMALNASLNDPTKQGDFTSAISEILDRIEADQPDLFSRLTLEELRVEVPDLSGFGTGAGGAGGGEFPTVDETTAKTEHKCPRCGYEYS